MSDGKIMVSQCKAHIYRSAQLTKKPFGDFTATSWLTLLPVERLISRGAASDLCHSWIHTKQACWAQSAGMLPIGLLLSDSCIPPVKNWMQTERSGLFKHQRMFQSFCLNSSVRKTEYFWIFQVSVFLSFLLKWFRFHFLSLCDTWVLLLFPLHDSLVTLFFFFVTLKPSFFLIFRSFFSYPFCSFTSTSGLFVLLQTLRVCWCFLSCKVFLFHKSPSLVFFCWSPQLWHLLGLKLFF